MNNIVFKVAPRGEGKTRWLLEAAHKYAKTHRVYLHTHLTNDFSRFCEKYHILFNEVCPVMKYSGVELDEKCVLLIDDLFAQNMSTTEVNFLSRHCYKTFITLEGVTEGDEFETESKYLNRSNREEKGRELETKLKHK